MISFHDLTLGYDRHPAIHHLNGRVETGSLTAIVGPNGAGKSTLLKAIAGQMRPLSGSIERGHHQIEDIAYLPQQSEIDRTFPINVLDTVALGNWRRCGAFGKINRADKERALAALTTVGMENFAQRPINNLSVGQFQRVLFARVLLQDCKLILLDEPFASLDNRTTADLLAVIHQWHEEGRTILAVLHDLEQAMTHFPETLLLARETVAWGPSAKVLSRENMLKARAHAEEWNDDAEVCHRENVAGGQKP